MLMRHNVAAGIGSNEQGEYCRAALQRSDRKEPRYKWPTLLYFLLISPHIRLSVRDKTRCIQQSEEEQDGMAYLIVWFHTLDTRLTLHALPFVALNDRNHFLGEIQA